MAKAALPKDPLRFIRRHLLEGKVRWTYHATMRLASRSFRSEILLKAAESLEIMESYPDDKYLPSYLLRGELEGAVFHAHIAADVEGDNVRVVTLYLPSVDEWDAEFRKRRTKP